VVEKIIEIYLGFVRIFYNGPFEEFVGFVKLFPVPVISSAVKHPFPGGCGNIGKNNSEKNYKKKYCSG
jgi:hypothetical protein